MVNYSLHFIGLHLNLLRNGKKLTETGIHCFAALTRGIFFNTRWTKFVSPCDHVISTMLKNATVRILSPSQPFLGSSRNAPVPKRLTLLKRSVAWRPWKWLLAHPIPQALPALFFSFIIILNSILVQIFKRLFTVQISNTPNWEANIKQERIMMAFTPIKCYGNYHRFCFLQKFNKRSRNSESHEKLPPAKSVMAWLILHFPGTYWNFYFAKAKLHHDGAVTFTGSVTSWKIKYYGKVTFASSRGCCCVISFEQQKNDGAFLAKFKKCYESRSQYEGGNCCCILSQKCKFTFDLLISQSLSMFWRCSRAATIAVGIWLETIADLFARFWDFRGS